MENKIDIAAILKDCPRGMELDCTIYDGVTLDSVVFESEYHYENTNTYPIKIVTKSGFSTKLTKYGQNVDISEAKCVIFPKGKKTWEGFQRPFVDGDIIADDHGNIAIYKGTMWYNKKLANYHCGYRKSDNKFLPKAKKDGHFGLIEELHFASEGEKRKLFDMIKENEYEWDSENKTLEKIKLKFKDGDILFVDVNDKGGDDDCYKYVFIFEKMVGRNKEEMVGSKVMAHCYMTADGYFKPRNVYLTDSTYPIRFATEKEKQKLFQTINDNGYNWNEKTTVLEELIKPTFKAGNKIKHKENAEWVCTIERVEDRYYVVGHPTRFTILFSEQDKYELVPNKFDINTLKTFDEVLVRLTNNCVWMPKLFSHYDTDSKGKYYPFVTIDNLGYPQCIPYNGNEHLCRKTYNCDEFYRVWEK
jgi:hypothetical protein